MIGLLRLLTLLACLPLLSGLSPAGPWPLALLALGCEALTAPLSLAPSLFLGLSLLPQGLAWAALGVMMVVLLRWTSPWRPLLPLVALLPCFWAVPHLGTESTGSGLVLVHLHLLLTLALGTASGCSLRPGEAAVLWATGCLALAMNLAGAWAGLGAPVLLGLALASRGQAREAEQFRLRQLDRQLQRSQASLATTRQQLHQVEHAARNEADYNQQLQFWLQRLALLLEALQALARCPQESDQWATLENWLPRLLPHDQRQVYRGSQGGQEALLQSLRSSPPRLLAAPNPTGLGFCLGAEEECLGVIVLQRQQPYSEEDRQFAAVLGYQVALTLRNARLRQEALQAYDQLQASQAQMVESSKLAAVGQLAAGMAHELNTPLATVLMAVEMAQLEASSPQSRDNLELARRQVQRAQALIEKVLYYSRDARAGSQPCQLNDIVQDTLLLVESQLRQAHISLQSQPGELPRVIANANELQQVVLNLVLNARDALEGRPEPRLLVATRSTPGGVELLVEDNGCGMTPEVQQRIFEPFFTTKEPGRGTGLGLSISREIIEHHGGKLQLISYPDQGCRALVWLPV